MQNIKNQFGLYRTLTEQFNLFDDNADQVQLSKD